MGVYDVQASIGIDYDPSPLVAYVSHTFGVPLPVTFPAPAFYNGQQFNYYVNVIE